VFRVRLVSAVTVASLRVKRTLTLELTACRFDGTLRAMRLRPPIMYVWIKWILLAVLISGCASFRNPLTQKTEYDTLMPGWESKFSIEWQVQREPDGTSLLYGRITSHYGVFASPFRVLGMALDSSGRVIGQRIVWVPGGVPGFAPVYFEIGHLPTATSYKVSVWDYTFIEARQVEAP